MARTDATGLLCSCIFYQPYEGSMYIEKADLSSLVPQNSQDSEEREVHQDH